MHTYLKLLLLSGILLCLMACQPESFIKKTATTEVDSSLHFQQVDISDLFLDTIFQNPNQHVTLSIKIPPKPEPTLARPKFREIEGYRIQVFAGLDSLRAEVLRLQIKQVLPDSIYVFHDRGLIKVQAGDFLYRPQADNARQILIRNGFEGPWVVQRSILVPVSSDSSETLATQLAVDEKYKIQVAAVGSQAKAEILISELKSKLQQNVFHSSRDKLYKIFVGPFKNESTAREILGAIRNLGYEDAWLVY